MARTLTIAVTEVSDASRSYVIAEVGHNHQGSLKTCKELFKAAKDVGASAVKLQKRNNRALYTKALYDKPYDNENSYGPTYGMHREALEFGRAEYAELQRYCKDIGIDFFATAFDCDSADFLAAMDMPAFKIASGDLKNTPLLEHVAKFQKPVIISTGGSTIEDVRRAHDAVMQHNPRVCVLQCTAGYPADWTELDLRVIGVYREMFPNTVVGFSGHDNGIAIAVAAYVLGARVIEKHFTLNRAWKGTDHAFSLEPVGMRKMVRDLERTWQALGDGSKKVYPSEVNPIIKMGKKVVAARALPAGHVITERDVAFKSPGDGIPPCDIANVIGRTILQPLAEDDAITLQDLSQ